MAIWVVSDSVCRVEDSTCVLLQERLTMVIPLVVLLSVVARFASGAVKEESHSCGVFQDLFVHVKRFLNYKLSCQLCL
jgi:hypothetical protein